MLPTTFYGNQKQPVNYSLILFGVEIHETHQISTAAVLATSNPVDVYIDRANYSRSPIVEDKILVFRVDVFHI